MTGVVSGNTLAHSSKELAILVSEDLAELRKGKVKPSIGDTRCIAYGHLVRMAIWDLRSDWDKGAGTRKKIAVIAAWLREFGGWPAVEKHLSESYAPCHAYSLVAVGETTDKYGAEYANVSF